MILENGIWSALREKKIHFLWSLLALNHGTIDDSSGELSSVNILQTQLGDITSQHSFFFFFMYFQDKVTQTRSMYWNAQESSDHEQNVSTKILDTLRSLKCNPHHSWPFENHGNEDIFFLWACAVVSSADSPASWTLAWRFIFHLLCFLSSL